MARFHFIFGMLVFVIFMITGQFMRLDFPDKGAIPQELRLLMRSRHIYILFSGLIHLALGLYLTLPAAAWRWRLQSSGSLVLVASTVLLIWGFVAETYFFSQFSEISRFGIYLSLAGVALHALAMLGTKSR